MYKKTSIVMASAITAILSFALVSANQAFAVTTVSGGPGCSIAAVTCTGGNGGNGGTGGKGGNGGTIINTASPITGQTGGTNNGGANLASGGTANGGPANGGNGGSANGGSGGGFFGGGATGWDFGSTC